MVCCLSPLVDHTRASLALRSDLLVEAFLSPVSSHLPCVLPSRTSLPYRPLFLSRVLMPSPMQTARRGESKKNGGGSETTAHARATYVRVLIHGCFVCVFADANKIMRKKESSARVFAPLNPSFVMPFFLFYFLCLLLYHECWMLPCVGS